MRRFGMQDTEAGSHTVRDCKYHLVWITKYRYPVLGRGCRTPGARTAARDRAGQEMTIYAGSINRDHVHMLIGIPPYLSVSRAVQCLKGKSSHKLLSEYQSFGSGTGASISGLGATGSRRAETSPTRCGRSISRRKNRKRPTTTSKSCSQSTWGTLTGLSRNPKPPPLAGGRSL